MKTIILSSVIRHYEIFFNPNKKYDLSTQSHVLMWVLHIWKNHACIIIIMAGMFFEKLKDQSCNAQKIRSGKIDFFGLRYIKILSCHMVKKCSKQHLTWKWQQCMHTHHQNMYYYIGNLFCIVVHIVHVLIL